MASTFAGLQLKTPIASTIIPRSSNSASARLLRQNCIITCKASSSSAANSNSLTNYIDFDLYDLLGIDSTSDQSQIKTAYRNLQKKCHPDIAGQAGHDMAIILNEAYSLLSDPNSRLAYDQEQAKIGELRGYTGKPMYSTWLGSESEERAVFVDEVKCVGCLKCALFAQNTFAIESRYGRARVVAQWADPEHKIQEAIQICPVDCISMVDRADLAALEYLMSKQPRGNVRVGAGSTGGTRVANIFVDVKKFQTRFADAMDKAATKEKDVNWAAIQAIRSISNLFYWQTPASQSCQYLTTTTQKPTEPIIEKLRAAAAAVKQARQDGTKAIHGISSNNTSDEYWFPSTQPIPDSTQISLSSKTASRNRKWKKTNEKQYKEVESNTRNPIAMGIPVVMAAIAVAIVRLQVSQGVVGDIKDHVGGSLALDIVNSSWLPVILTGITWYFIGVAIVQLIQVIGNRAE
ncbi:hypothetical protein Ddye_030512 [Dipteronia dyeriana]|uniref:J domain-containing protein n=1 Tax=Dipteronia dyeriana TaxID=168575 RepID=A0AAD9TGF6_9ROSI|nr:hypothetical protein Ddye_030512 [Dipteronia dyeriana]